MKQVEAAKADGRWDRAYKSGKDMKIPADLQMAIDAEPKAKAMLAKLSAQNRFALAFRTHNMKTEAGRKKKIETFVAMLKRGRRFTRNARNERRWADRSLGALAGLGIPLWPAHCAQLSALSPPQNS